jgi:hypothetical protein
MWAHNDGVRPEHIDELVFEKNTPAPAGVFSNINDGT